MEEYTDILFSPRVNETLIKDLNPLDQVEINLTTDETAVFDIRYFSFQFSRVYEKKGFDTLLVTVKDITEQVRLAEQLKEAREVHQGDRYAPLHHSCGWRYAHPLSSDHG